ncbi:MAG: hypothetical protein R6U20_07195 [Longimonas sp.]|uniref:hypothetical protein n=1 Tax=Longimonas sp. TaxID=2039626 RepID=UPI0039765549
MITRLLAGCMLLTSVVALAPAPVDAQVPDTTRIDSMSTRQGTMDLVGWPDRDQVEAWSDDLSDRWLPQFDRIQVDYNYAMRDSTTDWTFEVAWSPGAWVHAGDDGIQPLSEVEGPGRLEQLYVVANAVVDDSTRGTALFAFDQMNVGPRPDSVELSWRDVPHEELFLELDAEAARALLAQNPTFEIVEVERVQALPPDRRRVASGEQETREERRAPRTTEPRARRSNSVFIIRTGYVFGRTRSRTVAQPPSAEPATPADESARGGRGSTRTEDSGDEADDDRPRRDDDDDDAPSLGPAALGAAAVVGIAAVAGGSVGLSGSGDAPLGLTSGWTGERGGVWLQASINGAVLTGEGTERLNTQLRGFADVGWNEVQPSLGLGLRFEQEGDDIVSRPIVAPGVVWNAHEWAFTAGFDLVNSAPQFGIVYNFRAGSSE